MPEKTQKYDIKNHIDENREQYNVLGLLLFIAYAPSFLSIKSVLGLGLSFLFILMSVLVMQSIRKTFWRTKRMTLEFVLYSIAFELAFISITLFILTTHRENAQLPATIILAASLCMLTNNLLIKRFTKEVDNLFVKIIIHVASYAVITIASYYLLELMYATVIVTLQELM